MSERKRAPQQCSNQTGTARQNIKRSPEESDSPTPKRMKGTFVTPNPYISTSSSAARTKPDIPIPTFQFTKTTNTTTESVYKAYVVKSPEKMPPTPAKEAFTEAHKSNEEEDDLPPRFSKLDEEIICAYTGKKKRVSDTSFLPQSVRVLIDEVLSCVRAFMDVATGESINVNQNLRDLYNLSIYKLDGPELAAVFIPELHAHVSRMEENFNQHRTMIQCLSKALD